MTVVTLLRTALIWPQSRDSPASQAQRSDKKLRSFSLTSIWHLQDWVLISPVSGQRQNCPPELKEKILKSLKRFHCKAFLHGLIVKWLHIKMHWWKASLSFCFPFVESFLHKYNYSYSVVKVLTPFPHTVKVPFWSWCLLESVFIESFGLLKLCMSALSPILPHWWLYGLSLGNYWVLLLRDLNLM